MEEKLIGLVESVSETDSQNKLTTEKIRQWLLAHRSQHAQEIKRFPQNEHEPHFDLIMADYDLKRDGLFVVAIFRSDKVTLSAGRGNSFKVREFAESDFPEDISQVLPELQSRFVTANQPLTVTELELNAWLGM